MNHNLKMTQVAELSERQFKSISQLVFRLAGIDLNPAKKQLVKARLNTRLRDLSIPDFDTYLRYLKDDQTGNELVTMLDSISTNLTSFFREGHHFACLREEVLPEIMNRTQDSRRLRIWSAGCSSGQEPYSIAITLREALRHSGQWNVKILATDLSTRVLEKAAAGVYQQDQVKGIPKQVLLRHFDKLTTNSGDAWRIKPAIQGMITFGRLNLMECWPMRGPLDVIFCRNVMIYFKKETQNMLINRYYDLLRPGGYMFLGHSECLAGTSNRFRYIKPTVYQK
jgi:chemotaxis protein methyltransferase CheR